MLLRNYDNIMTVNSFPYFLDRTYYTEKGFTDGLLCCKLTNGDIAHIARYNAHPTNVPFVNLQNIANNYSANNLICGSGTTPETYDDYCLESIFTTSEVQNLSHKTSSLVYDELTNTFTITYSKTFLALVNIKVGEVGIMSPYFNYNTGGASTIALVYRKAFDTAIDVPANANFVLSFTITVNANSNKPTDYDASAALVE